MPLTLSVAAARWALSGVSEMDAERSNNRARSKTSHINKLMKFEAEITEEEENAV